MPLIRDRRPQVLVTYNEIGGYGHPDHIQAHRVAMYGYQLAAMPHYRPDLGPAWQVDRVLWTTMSETRMREGLRALRAAGDTETFGGLDPEGPVGPMAAPDDAIAVEIDGGHVGRAQAGRHARPRHPDHRRTASSSPAPTILGRRRCGRTSTTGWRPASRIPDPSRLGRRHLRRPEAPTS